MPEEIHRRCDCNACDVVLTGLSTHGGSDGIYCSEMCHRHAGSELWRAEIDHEREEA